jgi:hypothetical protein
MPSTRYTLTFFVVKERTFKPLCDTKSLNIVPHSARLRQVAKEVSEAKSAEGVLYVNFEEMKFPAKLDKDFLIKIYEAYREFINFRENEI